MSQKIKIKGIGKQANPPAAVEGGEVDLMFDKLGRQVITQFHVREMMATATASLTTGTSTQLIAGISGIFLDLIHVTFSNNSTVAAQVSLSDDGTLRNYEIPAGGVLEVEPPVPMSQNAKGGQWNVDMEDITGTTVFVEAIFIKNI